MCGVSVSLGIWKDPLSASNPEHVPFPYAPSSLLYLVAASETCPLPLCFCLHVQLLWECTNPHDLSYRQGQGPRGADKPEVPFHNWVVPE